MRVAVIGAGVTGLVAAHRLSQAGHVCDVYERWPGLRVLGEPEAHLLAVTGDGADVFAVGDAMHTRGWYLDRQQPPDSLHMTVSAGNAPVVDDFLGDLGASVDEAGAANTEDRSTNYATLE